MSSVTAESVATAPTEKRKSGLVSMFEHTKYVLGENRVTAFAFGLLVVILFVMAWDGSQAHSASMIR